ncbi:hypothetical protein WP50_17895 [Lactiplantibacillus plantarum]|nr:hypothetical protein WP50_17895 [Lactiplantibacillus plantarum]
MQWKLFATVATLTATTGVLLVGCGQSSSSSSNAGNTTAKMAKTQVLNWSENGQDLSNHGQTSSGQPQHHYHG